MDGIGSVLRRRGATALRKRRNADAAASRACKAAAFRAQVACSVDHIIHVDEGMDY